MGSPGKLMMVAGLALILAGLLFWLLETRAGGLGWFGRLPGDIRIERPGFRFYIPISTMVLVSLVLSLFLWAINRIGK